MKIENIGKDFENKPFRSLVKYGSMLLVCFFLLGSVVYSLGWFTETAQVVRKEFGPREMLRKYEWFKDAAAQLDKKNADIIVYDSRLKALVADYEGMRRNEWARDDREQSSLWSTEVAGIKASFNMLAADYNSQIAKFNWSFANAGQLPKGATEPLPREFKGYLTD